jgi:hypothetical protein
LPCTSSRAKTASGSGTFIARAQAHHTSRVARPLWVSSSISTTCFKAVLELREEGPTALRDLGGERGGVSGPQGQPRVAAHAGAVFGAAEALVALPDRGEHRGVLRAARLVGGPPLAVGEERRRGHHVGLGDEARRRRGR